MKSERSSNMSSLMEAQAHMFTIAGDKGSVKERINRAYARLRKTGRFTYNRVRDIFHAEPRVHIWAEELDELRSFSSSVLEEEEARNEYRDAQQFLSQLEAALRVAQDENFYSPTIDAIRQILAGNGRKDRPVAGE